MQSKLLQFDERMQSFVKTAKDHIEKAALELHMQMSPNSPKTPFTPKTPASPTGKPNLLRRTTINESLALKSRMSMLSNITQADKALNFVEEEDLEQEAKEISFDLQ